MPNLTSFSATITANGDYVFPDLATGSEAILEAGGAVFGGGTITPGYIDAAGLFVAYLDAVGATQPTTSSRQWKVVVPCSNKVVLRLAGSTNPAIPVILNSYSKIR